MTAFVLINRFREGQGPAEGTPAHADEMRRWEEVNRALSESGDLLWSLALTEPRRAAACSTDESGKLRRLTGREASPEGVFALYLVEVADQAAAEKWAACMPTAAYGVVEVRAVTSLDPA